MSVEQKDVKGIFLHAVGISSTEGRVAYLDEACAGDEEVRLRVEALIFAHERPESLLDRAALQDDVERKVEATIDQPVPEQRGTEVGPYKLLQKLGEGGMGVVYMAEQSEPVERRVALKIIKPGMDSRQVIARFEAERQALALMDHPNIAKVLDAATTNTGQPYFVMELVKGIPLTEYCDEQHLTTKERLELFIPVCQAVQHAHQKGIIHRDLKPSNVLVALYDGRPIPKVIDFGVAKATSQKLTQKTMFTAVGQIVGTLEYMSPEQAQLNQLDIDTRSDVYSLGVLLYELLTGVTPFDRARLRSAAFDEILRIIREEEPPRPSMRLSTIKTLPSVAANRRVEPQKLRTLVRGELDWIVMKALEKDRARRYETATGFAADIQRYLVDQPVVACPPSAGYRFRKFARRNKALLVTISMIAIALMLGMASTSWQAIRATLAEREADRERDTARTERYRATNEARRANVQLRIATGMRLAAQSQLIEKKSPVQSLLLAVEAVETTRRIDGTVTPIAHESLLSATSNIGGIQLFRNEGRVYEALISPDGRWLAVTAGSLTGGAENGTVSGTVRLFDIQAPDRFSSPVDLEGHTERVNAAAFSANSRWLVTAGFDLTARVWDLSTAEPNASPIVLQGGHRGPINDVAISPDGRWVATGSRDETAQLWDLTAQDTVKSSVKLEHQGWVTGVAISPDGHWLVTGSRDKTARCWDLTAKDPKSSMVVLTGHQDFAGSVAISPDGRWLVTGSRDKTARCWDLNADTPAALSHVLRGHDGNVGALAISADSRWLVTGSSDKTVRCWDLTAADPASSSRVLRGHTNTVSSVAIGPDCRWLATGSLDGTARLWDLSDDDPSSSSLVLRGHDDTVSSVEVSPNGRLLVTGSWDGTVRLWDLDSENPGSSLVVHGYEHISATPDDHRLVAADSDGKIRLWELTTTGQEPVASSLILRGHEGRLSSLSLSRDSRWLATGSWDSKARLWDLHHPEAPPQVFAGHEGRILAVAISWNGRWMATADYDKTALLWDLSRAETPRLELPVYQAAEFSRSPVAFSPDGRWLVTQSAGMIALTQQDTAHVWDLSQSDPTSSPVRLPGNKWGVASLAISPDSRWLVTANWDGTTRLWDLKSTDPASNPVELAGHAYGAVEVAFSQNGRWLVTASFDHTARIWNLSAPDPGASSVKLAGHAANLQSLAISPNSRLVATGSEDGTARIWDLTAEDPSASSLVLRGHEATVASIVFGPDSRWIVTRSDDRNIRFWDLNLGSLLERARRLAGRALTPAERIRYMVPRTDEPFARVMSD